MITLRKPLSILITLCIAATMVLTGCNIPFMGDDHNEMVQRSEYVSPYAQWPDSVLNKTDFFPIMVWAQDTRLAPHYKEMGVNTYLALWQGPTEQQLATLAENGMYTICAQNETALKNLDNPTIMAWMHGDEPDNYQQNYKGPVPLGKITTDYMAMVANDPSRPVLVNFGQGVANDQFKGRVLPYERYGLYAQGADILSYDVYPVANIKFTNTDEEGKKFGDIRDDGGELLWYVAKGLDNLRQWSGDAKPVWNVLECTAISHPRDKKVTPHQMRAEVWMSIVHGSRGICWFCHDFREGHRSASAILADEQLKAAVTENNLLIQLLAPVINSADIKGLVKLETTNEVPVDIMVREYEGSAYIFAVCMRNEATEVSFTLNAEPADDAKVEVQGEQRTIELDDENFTDTFEGFGVHIYKIPLDMD